MWWRNGWRRSTRKGPTGFRPPSWTRSATFSTSWADEQETLDTIGSTYNDFQYVLDPHTAVAWHALAKYRLVSSDESYGIVLSTASPYKFSQSVLEGLNKADKVTGDGPFAAAHALHEVTELPLPAQITKLEQLPVLHKDIIAPQDMAAAILATLDIQD